MSALVNNKKTVKSLLNDNLKQIAMALPKHMSAERMLRIVTTELNRNPKLGECDPLSFCGAVIKSSQLGLEPGVHSHLVPYKKEVQLIPDYRGLMDLARRSGQIGSIQANVIRENDLFEFEYGLNQNLRHIPARDNRGQVIGAYAIATSRDVMPWRQFEVMWKTDIDAIRARSKASNGPWNSDYEAMAKKTVVRQLCKYLPTSVELQSAVIIDEVNERGESQQNGQYIDFEDIPETAYITQTEKLNQVLEEGCT